MSTSPHVYCIPELCTSTCTYIVHDINKKTIIIDPVANYNAAAARITFQHADTVLEFITTNNLMVELILETHAHADHLTGMQYIRSELGKKGVFPKIAIGANITKVQKLFAPKYNYKDLKTDGSQWDFLMQEGKEIVVGDLKINTLYTPGHTPACSSYIIGDTIFTGDALFQPDIGCGRVDFPGGNAEDIWNSNREKIFKLPNNVTRVFVGHDYPPKTREFKWEMLKQDIKKEDFIKLRNERDSHLSVPALLLPSIQYNIRAGELPPPEDNGISYMKLPVNFL